MATSKQHCNICGGGLWKGSPSYWVIAGHEVCTKCVDVAVEVACERTGDAVAEQLLAEVGDEHMDWYSPWACGKGD